MVVVVVVVVVSGLGLGALGFCWSAGQFISSLPSSPALWVSLWFSLWLWFWQSGWCNVCLGCGAASGVAGVAAAESGWAGSMLGAMLLSVRSARRAPGGTVTAICAISAVCGLSLSVAWMRPKPPSGEAVEDGGRCACSAGGETGVPCVLRGRQASLASNHEAARPSFSLSFRLFVFFQSFFFFFASSSFVFAC